RLQGKRLWSAVPSGPGPTLAKSTRRWTNGRHERSRRTAADRGGGRLVRVPGSHPLAIGGALPGSRALGLGPLVAAASRRQGANGEAAAGGGGVDGETAVAL